MQAAYFLERLGGLRFDAEASRAKLMWTFSGWLTPASRHGQVTCVASSALRKLR